MTEQNLQLTFEPNPKVELVPWSESQNNMHNQCQEEPVIYQSNEPSIPPIQGNQRKQGTCGFKTMQGTINGGFEKVKIKLLLKL